MHCDPSSCDFFKHDRGDRERGAGNGGERKRETREPADTEHVGNYKVGRLSFSFRLFLCDFLKIVHDR